MIHNLDSLIYKNQLKNEINRTNTKDIYNEQNNKRTE